MLRNRFSIVLVVLFWPALPAWGGDFDWLEAAVSRAVGGGSEVRTYVAAAKAAPHRAAVFFAEDSRTKVRLLYSSRHDRGASVEFRGKNRLPEFSSLASYIYRLELLPDNFHPLDRARIANDSSMAAVMIAWNLLESLPEDCGDVIVHDEFMVAARNHAPGGLAVQCELVGAMIAPLDKIGVVGLDVTHMHRSALEEVALLKSLLELSQGGKKTILSFGRDTNRGLEMYADDQWHSRMASPSNSVWNSRPFADDSTILQRLDRCRPFVGAGHREAGAAVWTDHDLISVRSLSCLDGQSALSTWHRHPRFYSLSK